MTLYRIKDNVTGMYFSKLHTGMWIYNTKENKHYKYSEWSEFGRFFDTKKKVNSMFKNLTTIQKSSKIRKYEVYPQHIAENLEIVPIEVE